MNRIAQVIGAALITLAGHSATAAPQKARDVVLDLREGTWMGVAVSPDGKTILFDLLNDIYSVPATGGEARALLSGPDSQRNPKFSPDGRMIAYLSDASGDDNIWIANVDGAGARQISHEKTNIITAPEWAADGKSVFATYSRAAFDALRISEIRRYPIDGSAETVVVPEPENKKDVQESNAAPDGRTLYYTHRVGGQHFVYLNPELDNFHVEALDLSTGATRPVVTGFGSATTPRVSPDGKSMAFIRRVGAKTVLFRQDLAANQQFPVYADLARDLQADYISQEHYYPAFGWFPDSRHVAIWGKGKLYKIDMWNGAATPIPFHARARLTLQPAVRFQQDQDQDTVDVRIIRHLAPSPKGDRLVFHALGKLWTQDLASRTAPRRLTASSDAEHEPTWSPDGRFIAFVDWNDEAGSKLILHDAGTGREKVLASSRRVMRFPAFAPDGESVGYQLMDVDAGMNGRGEETGLYIVGTRAGSVPRRITASAAMLRFSPDGNQVYFLGEPDYGSGRTSIIKSISRDGGEPVTRAFNANLDVSEITLSPDLKWLTFKEIHRLYVAPFDPAARDVAVSAETLPRARRLTADGGYEASWSPDSRRLYWMLGRQLYSTAPEDAGIRSAPDREIVIAQRTDRPTGSIAFTNGRVIPIVGDVIDRGTVVVVGNRIAAVGRAGSVAIPAGAKVIDISGKTIMPGFFDAHGHIDCCYGTGVLPQKEATRYAALAYGVTTNLDPYSNDLISYESGEMTRAGSMVGPRWIHSGQVIYGRSGRSDNTYNPMPTWEDARSTLRRKKALGPFSILKSYKIVPREQERWLIEAAREAGYMVDAEGAGHFYNDISMITDGTTNLEHNMPVATYYDDLVQLFVAAHQSTTPTLIVAFGELFGENYIYQTEEPWKDPKVRTFISDVNNAYNPIIGAGGAPLEVRAMNSIHYADELYDIGFRSVSRTMKRLDDAGVVINVGSHGQAPGVAMNWEMRLLSEGGMAPARILRAATLNPAITWGVDHQLGSIEPGKLADLIVLDRNPLDDIRNTNSVRYTMVNGRLYDSYTMDEIGNHPRPRTHFYWESTNPRGTEWTPAWAQ